MEWVSIAEKIWNDVKYKDPRYRAGVVSLPLKSRLYFSLGHVLSDLCYIVWSTYMLIYFNKVVGLSPSSVGYLFMIAQCSDAFLTPFIEVGINRICPRVFPSYGRRKLWHLFGTVLVFLTWPLVFSSCLVCSDSSSKLGYYSIVVILLHVGWSIVRITHQTLMPDIVKSREEEEELNAIRSWVSFVCGMIIFSITWILLGQADGKMVTPFLKQQFTDLSLVTVVGFGLVFSFLFHWGTTEPRAVSCQSQRPAVTSGDSKANNKKASSRDLYVLRRHTESCMSLTQQTEQGLSGQIEGGGDDQDQGPCLTWRQWLNDYDLYKVAVVYICSRVVCTILQLYIVFYVTDSLGFTKEAIAYFPLTLLITEVVANTVVTTIRKVIGNKLTFCAASVIVFQSCIWFHLQSRSGHEFVFLSSILFGASSSFMMATSLAMLGDLAKKDKRSSGFIYSTMGFFDKILVGLFILIIQRNYPDNGIGCYTCGNYVRLVITLTPTVFTAIALLVVIFAFKTNVSITCKQSEDQDDQWTQTNIDSPPQQSVQANGSIYTINEENDVTKSNDDILNPRDEYDNKIVLAQGKDMLYRSAPVLSMRRSFSFPATAPKSSAHRSSIPECQTLEGVALAVEKVVVFSFDSLSAGELLSERTSSLPPASLDEDKEETDEKSSENIYQKVSLLRSTEL